MYNFFLSSLTPDKFWISRFSRKNGEPWNFQSTKPMLQPGQSEIYSIFAYIKISVHKATFVAKVMAYKGHEVAAVVESLSSVQLDVK